MGKATPQAELLGAELHLELPEQPVFVQSDPTHLTRIVDNLVNNALAYSQGRPWVRVTVRADDASERAAPASAWLTVEDRGVGIPPEMRERIVDRVVRLEAPGQTLQ